MTIDKQKPIKQFQLKGRDLTDAPHLNGEYEAYAKSREAYANALRELNQSNERLKEKLDEPLRQAGLIVGADWSFKPNAEADGLIVQCWSQPKHKGKRPAEIETVSFPFQGRSVKRTA